MKREAMFTSKTDNWATPQALFDELDAEFHFTLDPCADEANHKCALYFDREQDGLAQDWGGHTVFCNPPYGAKATGDWTRKAYEEAQKPDTTVVLLIPARTDRKSFHDYIYKKTNVEIRFLKGRLKFGDGREPAPFPSMVVVFR